MSLSGDPYHEIDAHEARMEDEHALHDAIAEPFRVREEELVRRLKVAEAALVRLRDCDWVITPAHRMDAVRDIARDALADITSPL